MTNEYYVDRISNVSVQGSVISIDLGRLVPKPEDKKSFTLENRLTVTLTGQNFMNFVKTLNESLQAIADRQKTNATNDNTITTSTADKK